MSASSSPFKIALSPEQREELERRARSTTRLRTGRWCVPKSCSWADGTANKEITEQVGTSPQVVHRWRRRFCEQGLEALKDRPRSGRPWAYSSQVAVEVKALACELPATSGVPLSRWSCAAAARELVLRGVVAFISAATVRGALAKDAIRPWYHR